MDRNEDSKNTTLSYEDLEELKRLLNLDSSVKEVGWKERVGIYIAIAGVAFSGIQVYTNILTRMSNLETRVEYITQLVTELKMDVKEIRKNR